MLFNTQQEAYEFWESLNEPIPVRRYDDRIDEFKEWLEENAVAWPNLNLQD